MNTTRRSPRPLLLALPLLLPACSAEESLAERVAEGPILALVDPALPVARFYVAPRALGWADAAPGVEDGDFDLTCWEERNGTPGMQLEEPRPDVVLSNTSGTAEWAVAVGAAGGPELRTRLRIDVAEGESIERVLCGGPISGWPPQGADAWRPLARLEDLGVALEMLGEGDDGQTAFRLRATGRDAEAAPLRLTIEIVDATSDGQGILPDAVNHIAQDEATVEQYATSWFSDHASGGVRMTLHVERADEDGAVEGLRLHVAPVDR